MASARGVAISFARLRMKRPKLVFTTTIMASFARNDLALLGERFALATHVFAPRSKWLTPWALVAQAIFLLRHLPSAKVSVTQFGGFHSWLPALMGRLFGVPSLISLGGFDCASFPSFRYGAHHRFPMGLLTRASLRMADHLVPCSQNLVSSRQVYSQAAGDPLEQGYMAFDPRNRTPSTVIGYGYDAQRFKPQGDRPPRTFLTVAQMNASNYERKGIDLLFESARRFPDCRFTLVGSGPEMRYASVPENVALLGFQPYERLPELYGSHAFYLQLSIWEGFPSALCEAMLCGCVPIVSRVAAMPDIVGDTGFYLEHRDANELERLIGQALSADWRMLSTAARDRIIRNHPREARRPYLELVSGIAGVEVTSPTSAS